MVGAVQLDHNHRCKHDFDEYQAMKEFALRQTEDRKDKLLNALSHKGAFGNFKDTVRMLGIEKF